MARPPSSIRLLEQAGTFRANEAKATEVRIMDSMDLERERGITILAKARRLSNGTTTT